MDIPSARGSADAELATHRPPTAWVARVVDLVEDSPFARPVTGVARPARRRAAEER